MQDLNWPGLAAAYIGYRGVQAVSRSMAGYKRKANYPVNKFGFRNKIRRPNLYNQHQRHTMYNKHNDMDTKFCVLKFMCCTPV